MVESIGKQSKSSKIRKWKIPKNINIYIDNNGNIHYDTFRNINKTTDAEE